MFPTRGSGATVSGYRWFDGIISGVAAGIAMGLLLQFGTGFMRLFGAIAGEPSLVRGWIVHLVISVLFALLFVAIVGHPLARDLMAEEERTVSGWVILGLVHGAALGIVTGGIVLPLAINMLGAAELPFPFLPVPGVAVSQFTQAIVLGLAHLVYGAVLGAVYAVL